MTPDQITTIRQQLGLSQAGLADAINDLDPLMRCSRVTVARWEMDRANPNARTPSLRSVDALMRLWRASGRDLDQIGQ